MHLASVKSEYVKSGRVKSGRIKSGCVKSVSEGQSSNRYVKRTHCCCQYDSGGIHPLVLEPQALELETKLLNQMALEGAYKGDAQERRYLPQQCSRCIQKYKVRHS